MKLDITLSSWVIQKLTFCIFYSRIKWTSITRVHCAKFCSFYQVSTRILLQKLFLILLSHVTIIVFLTPTLSKGDSKNWYRWCCFSKCHVTGLRNNLNLWNNEFEILIYNRSFNIILWYKNGPFLAFRIHRKTW